MDLEHKEKLSRFWNIRDLSNARNEYIIFSKRLLGIISTSRRWSRSKSVLSSGKIKIAVRD